MEIILLISLKLNFTPNTSGCYGLLKLKLGQVILNMVARFKALVT